MRHRYQMGAALLAAVLVIALSPTARAADKWNLQPTLHITVGAENVMTKAGADSTKVNPLAVVDAIAPAFEKDGDTLVAIWGEAAVRGMSGENVDLQQPQTYRAGEVYIGLMFKVRQYELKSGGTVASGLTAFIGGRTSLVEDNVTPEFAPVLGFGAMMVGPKWSLVAGVGVDKEGYGDVIDATTGQPPKRLQALVSVRVPIPILEGESGDASVFIFGVAASVHIFRGGFVGEHPDKDIVRFWVGIDPGALISRFKKS